MSRIFQNENPAPKHHRSLKMVVSMMVISFTLSSLVTFTELSEIYALPSRGGRAGGGGGLPSPGSHSTIHPGGAAPPSGAHTNGPGSLSNLNAGSNMINGPNGRHPNAPTVVNGPNGPHVVNPNSPTTSTTVVHPSDCSTVVHPNGANTNTVVHPSNCSSPNAKVSVNSDGSTSSSSTLTVNNVQQQGSSGGSTTKQSSQSVPICLAKNTIITVNVYGGMTRNLPFKAGQTSNTVQGISVSLKC